MSQINIHITYVYVYLSLCLFVSLLICLSSRITRQIFVDANGLHDALRHTQSSSCCAQNVTLCDQQAAVVGRLLTTLGDDRRGVTKFFLVQRLDEITIWLEKFEFHICLTNILQLQTALSPRSDALVPVEARPRPYALAQTSMHAMTVQTYCPEVSK